MAFAASSHQPAFSVEQSVRTPSICRVHSCARCGTAVDSVAPCSFAKSVVAVCRLCRSQEQVLIHLPTVRTSWAGSLARASR